MIGQTTLAAVVLTSYILQILQFKQTKFKIE